MDIKRIKAEIDEILLREDLHWKQSSKQNCFQNGDRNTQLFPSWVNHRRKINTIRSIIDGVGRVWRKKEYLSKLFLSYYSNPTGISNCLQFVNDRVTPTMNQRLLQPFMEEEVRVALFQMHSLKSPSRDGYSAGFYQKSWAVVGKEVTRAALSVLNGGSIEAGLNATNIGLIPKVTNPTSVTEFRPISLFNVLYKIISKAIANRLKHVLPHIISQEQSAFLPRRLITDNILVAFETLHTMDTRLKGREGFMAMKLDMSKAYDRLEWDFLEEMMRKLGFDNRWVNLLMSCVRTVSYAILVNGQPFGQIIPTRGIRQGNPLSSYLFILCAEAMSTMIQHSACESSIMGIPISRGGIRINHLLFADDSLLFCRANLREWDHIHRLLGQYEAASGQQLNHTKTSLFFSHNTRMDDKILILNGTGLNSTANFEKYLGLPALIGRSRISTFNGIKGWIWNRINGWKEKFLSHVGKEVLLKSVIQAIPTYTMSVFRLPKTLCKEINAMMGRFWWGHKENLSKIPWMSWKGMGKKKLEGGLGYRDLVSFNIALLAKQGWHLLKFPHTLAARVFKEKYFFFKVIF
jgi:hypothetical protein